jgi:xanthine dehydrogenase accessory factor
LRRFELATFWKEFLSTHQINSEQQIYVKIAEFLRAGKKFALAVVMKDAGSTPRKAGTKAIIDEEGSIWGTIGGGLLESDARKLAVAAIASGKPSVFDFKFAGKSAGEDDPVCGGNMRILIDPTPIRWTSVYLRVAQALAERRRGVLQRVINEWGVATAFYTRGCIKDEDDQFIDAVRRASGEGAVYFWHEEQQVEGLAEPIIPAPLLLIGGGGHVGQALARAAHLVGFDVVVIDDREDFSDPSLFGEGIRCRRGAFRDVLLEFPIDEDTYIALVGRGHKVDGKALLSCLNSPAAYIGMMGSRRKVALVKKEFIDGMLIDEEGWKKIHAPIGLDIGAQTVPEIAASIVAQMIAVRRRKEVPRLE